MISPYKGKSSDSFWKTGVANDNPFGPIDIYKKKWEIKHSWKIATAGSCFAQHISKYLIGAGYNVLDVEPPPLNLPEDRHKAFGYSTYSARFGNIYTVRQLLQLVKEVSGEWSPSDYIWEKDGRFFDALRPSVEPNGLSSPAEVMAHREFHIQKVKEMFMNMDLFIFTLGLTEAWYSKSTNTFYPTAPGTIAGTYTEDKFAFYNFQAGEIIKDFNDFMSIIKELRGGNAPRYILTVSPVPLTATASDDHVLLATTYSKSTLRAVAGQLSANQGHIDYFPSYEIITNPKARGMFFEDNLRSVRKEGVETVMKTFFLEHPAMAVDPTTTIDDTPDKDENDVQCEDALLEEFIG